ncbi:MAG TPA: CDP-alcohol phosphatidyltransferase family protein [Candidatus Limnocylindrales bacterium]
MLRTADFYAANRGGGIFSEAISQRLGAVIALWAARLGLRPTTVTLTNLVLGLITSALVGFHIPGAGWVALVGWQVAYAMDCADGQLARVTGQASPAGARVDVLCDVASHIALVSALVAVARPPVVLAAAFAGLWMVNVVTSVLAGPSMITKRSLMIRIFKGVRDYGAIVATAALILIIAPGLLIWFLVLSCVINAGFLLVSLIFAVRAAFAQPRVDADELVGDASGAE